VSIPNGTARCTAAGTRLRAWPTPMGPTTRAGIRPVIPDDRRRGRSCPLGFPSRPAHPSHDRIGRPLHPRASGAHTTGPISPAVPSSVQALSPRGCLLRGIVKGSLAFARPAFPSPGRSPGWDGGLGLLPWASHPAGRTCGTRSHHLVVTGMSTTHRTSGASWNQHVNGVGLLRTGSAGIGMAGVRSSANARAECT
jgi:hypothetical protein